MARRPPLPPDDPANESLLTCAAGNSTTSLCLWHGGEVERRWGWWTHEDRATLARFLTGIRRGWRGARFPPTVLAGVVPESRSAWWARRVAATSRRNAAAAIYRFRHELPCPLRIVPRPPQNVGDDRLAGALGALARDASCPWVIVDAGTAATVNAVRPAKPSDHQWLGTFEGGLILPGEALGLAALHAGTAQLPVLTPWPLRSPPPCIGRSTAEAMRAGVRRAQLAAVVALARAQAEALGPGARVVLTGGGAKALWPAVQKELRDLRPEWDPVLVHRGLYSAWRHARPTGAGL